MIDSLRLELQNYLGVSGLTGASIAVQLALIIGALTFLYLKLIKDSPVEKTVRGVLFFLVIIWLSAEVFMWLHLRILGALLQNLLLLIILSFIVIFQPELRRLMARLGNSLEMRSPAKKRQMNNRIVEILVQSIEYWQKHETGALIVFENQDPVSAFTTGGVPLSAKLSTELLINLFFINTPLHDGAVIIKNGVVETAGVVLPLSQDVGLNWKYGTRHRAAIGMSEESDALVLVVSEENGDVSLVKDGKIQTFHTLDDLAQKLSVFLAPLIKKTPSGCLWQRLKENIIKQLKG